MSIDARELRLGNWVLFDNIPDRVTGIYGNNVEGQRNSRFYMERISGVLITPEILFKAGFIPDIYDGVTWHEYHIPDFGKIVEGDKNGYCDVFLEKFPNLRYRYVHQLQNLIWILSGKEIELNL